MIGVVQRHGCNPKSIRLPPVALNAFFGQPFAQRSPLPGESDGDLCPAPFFLSAA